MSLGTLDNRVSLGTLRSSVPLATLDVSVPIRVSIPVPFFSVTVRVTFVRWIADVTPFMTPNVTLCLFQGL